MTEETARDIEKLLIDLLGRLKERCPQHAKDIEKNAKDIDAAFSNIRKLENKISRLMLLEGLALSMLGALLVKTFVQ